MGAQQKRMNALDKVVITTAFLAALVFFPGCGGGTDDQNPLDINSPPLNPDPIVPKESLSTLDCVEISIDKEYAKPFGRVFFTGISGADEDTLYIKVSDTRV